MTRRYNPAALHGQAQMAYSPNGEWVRYVDYAQLEAAARAVLADADEEYGTESLIFVDRDVIEALRAGLHDN